MSTSLKVSTVFSAVDKLSGPIKDATRKVGSSFAKIERRMTRLSSKSKDLGRKTGLFGLALATPLILATKEAVKFEDAMADVAKVANVEIGTAEFDKLGDSAKSLSKFLAIDAVEAGGLMANLAQGGVAIQDLDKVSKIAGKVGVAFGISADLAGESFIKTQNALGGTISDTEKLMDSINELGNTTAASSDKIITFMSSGGSASARAANVSGEAMAAFGAQFISMGKSGEESATIMSRFVKKAMLSNQLRSVFDEAGGGAEGMFAILEKGVSLTGKNQDAYFKQFGEYGLQVQLLAKNMDGLRKTYDTATDSVKTSGSVLKEFENRSNTTAFKMKKAKAEFMDAAITLGSALLPVITDLAKSLTPIITSISKWMKENKELTGTIVKVVAVVGAGSLALSGLSYAVSAVSGALAFLASPIGLVIAGVGALTLAVYAISKAWSDETTAMRINREMRDSVLDASRSERAEATLLFKALRDNKEGTEAYTSALSKLEQMQPGITEKYNLQKKSVDNLRLAEEDLINTIQRRAFEQVKADKLKGAMEKLISLKEGGVGFMDIAFRSPFESSEETAKNLIIEQQAVINAISTSKYEDVMPELNVNQERAKEEKTKVQVDITGLPEWMQPNVTAENGNARLIPGVSMSPTN